MCVFPDALESATDLPPASSFLAVYLLGSAAGCFVAILPLERILRPLRVFLLAQCAMLVATGAGLLFLVHALPGEPFFATYWRGYSFFALGQATDRAHVVRLYVLLPILLFGLPTAFMGFSFPVLQRAVLDDPRTSGRKVGFLQAANIGGCVAGSLLVGLVAVGALGTAATVRALVLAGAAFALLGWRRYGPAFAAPLLLIVAFGATLPDGEALWRRLHGLPPGGPQALFDEDATGAVALTEERPDGLSINPVRVKRGEPVIWVNHDPEPIKIKILTKLGIACAAPTNFYADLFGLYESIQIAQHAVASICFLEKGEYTYEAHRFVKSGDKVDEQIIPGNIIVE